MANYGSRVLWLLVGVVGMLAGPSPGQTPPPDKSAYHLFNPTPRELMRPLSADRPDATESPITVDAGHVQIETSLFSYTHDDDSGVRSEAWTVLDTNVKLGILNNLDLQIVFSAFNEETTDPDGGPSERLEGFGDVQIRTKLNLWGNDGGDTAFGVMPYIKIPTGTQLSNDHVEGGLIAMLGIDMAANWGLGFQAEVDFVYDDADDAYDTELLHTVVLGCDLVGPLGAFVEYIGIVSTDADSDYDALASTGLTWELSGDLMFDVAVQLGLTDDVDDVTVFTGLTVHY